MNDTREQYDLIKAMNPSTIVNGIRSMKRLKRVIDQGGIEPTPAMNLGTATHALLLEPEEFERQFAIVPDFHLDIENTSGTGKNLKQSESKATNYYKQKLSQFEADNSGKRILSAVKYYQARQAILAIRSRPHLMDIVNNYSKEQTLRGTILGVEFKGRVDLISVSRREIVDIKTTANIEKHAFGRQFANLNIAFKMSIYRQLAEQTYGTGFACSLITQEIQDDFDNAYVPIDSGVLDEAYQSVLDVVDRYKNALASGVWHGVDGGAIVYDLVTYSSKSEGLAWSDGSDFVTDDGDGVAF